MPHPVSPSATPSRIPHDGFLTMRLGLWHAVSGRPPLNGLWFLTCLAAVASCKPAPQQFAGPAAAYAVDAGGRPPAVTDALRLTWLGLPRAGLILNAEFCGDSVYLLAPGVKSVHVGNVSKGVVDRYIGTPGDGPENLRWPVSLAVDCGARRVYVVEGKGGILAFSADSGAFEDSYSYAAGFHPSMGTRAYFRSGHLILSGFWSSQPRTSWMKRDGLFSGKKIGLSLSLGEPSGRPIAETYERDCVTDFTACLRADVQPLDNGSGWVAAQGESTAIAVLNERGDVVRMIDIRSPKFLRDGSVPGETTEAQMEWGTRNSTIWGLYVVGDRIGVVHARNATKNWHGGLVMQFDVFMNVYSVNGDRLVSDLGLPGLPVGQDRGHVVVIDYGRDGRRADASSVALVKVPLTARPLGSQ